MPEIVYRFSGSTGEKISEEFTINDAGEIILIEYHSLASLFRVKLYESDKSEPIYDAVWQSNGDNFQNIKPGKYYIKVQLSSIDIAELIEDTYWHIEVWDK